MASQPSAAAAADELFDVEAFSTRMKDSNERLIARFMKALEARYPDPLPLDEEDEDTVPHDTRLDIFARFLWHHEGGIPEWPEFYMNAPYSITNFGQLADSLPDILSDVKLDGVILPARSTELRQLELRLLEEALNSRVERNVEGFSLPDEYAQFLEICDGVCDVDLRQEGVCEVAGIGTGYGVTMKQISQRVSELGIMDLVSGRTIKAGWELGSSSEAFCWWVLGRNEDSELEDWTWQIVYHQYEHTRVTTFDRLPEFLEWYVNWEERIDDLDQLVENLLDCCDL